MGSEGQAVNESDGKKKTKLEKEQAKTNTEVKKCRHNGEKQILLFEGRLYE